MSLLVLLELCGLDKYVKDERGIYHDFLLWNVVAAFAHLANAVASFYGASEIGKENKYPVFQDYALWQGKDDYCAGPCNGTGYSQTGMGQNFVILPTESKKSSELSLFWLIIGFHLLSFSFQIILNTSYCRQWYVNSVLNNGVNPVRFVEYSISASLMMICLGLISNILGLYALIGLGIMTCATQLFGLLAECLFSDVYLNDTRVIKSDSSKVPIKIRVANFQPSEVALIKKPKKPKLEKPRSDVLATSLRRLGWVAHFSGWITMIGAYGGILLNQYIWSVEQNNTNGVGPPEWVNVLIAVIAVLYNLFGFLQLFQLCAKDPYLNSLTGKRSKCSCVSNSESGDGRQIRFCGRSLNKAVELIYVLNSLATKTVLGWVIIGQLLRSEDVITTRIKCD